MVGALAPRNPGSPNRIPTSGDSHWGLVMYGRQPLNDLQLLTCPKCGAPQESPGSTVCELCGADLPHPGVKRPATPHSALRLHHFLRGPVRLLTLGVSVMQLFVLFAVRDTTFLLLLT